jgi:alpha-mannosidase
VQVSAITSGATEGELIVRLFEPTGSPRQTTVRLPSLGVSAEVSLGGFEIASLRLSLSEKTLIPCGLLG